MQTTAGGAHQTSVSTSADPLAAGSSTSIPWTIANKYYTADVHFEIHEFDRFRVLHAVGVPAIIYVWGPGEVSLPALRSPRGVPRFIESARAHGSAVSGARP